MGCKRFLLQEANEFAAAAQAEAADDASDAEEETPADLPERQLVTGRGRAVGVRLFPDGTPMPSAARRAPAGRS